MLSVYQRFAVDDQGKPIGSPEVTVLKAGTSSKAKLYADEKGTIPLKNPVRGDRNGLFRFFTAAGDYDITVHRGLITRALRNERVTGTAAVSDAARFPFDSVEAVERAWIPEDVIAITTLGRLRPGDGGGATLVRTRKEAGGPTRTLSNGGSVAWMVTGVVHVISVEDTSEMNALTGGTLDDGQQVSVRDVGIFRYDLANDAFVETDIAKSHWETLIAGAVSDFLKGEFGKLRVGAGLSGQTVPADTKVAVESDASILKRDVTAATGKVAYEFYADGDRMVDIEYDSNSGSPTMKTRFPTSGINPGVGNAVAELSATTFALSKGILPKTAVYTVSELNTYYPADEYTGAIAYCYNGAAGVPVIAFSNGVNWLRCDNRNLISET